MPIASPTCIWTARDERADSVSRLLSMDLQRNAPLARYTAARLGGPADYLYIAKDPTYADTLKLLRWAWERDLAVTALGGGANVLVADAGIRGLTIINKAARLERDGTLVVVSSGTSLIRLARACLDWGLSGMEWAIAVPGTVGGAVVNNAGAHAGDVASVLTRAQVYEAATGERWLGADEMEYAYRHSALKQRGRPALLSYERGVCVAARGAGSNPGAHGIQQRLSPAHAAARRQLGQHLQESARRLRRPTD